MRQINFIQFNYLRGEAHYQFLSKYNNLLLSFPEVKKSVSPHYKHFEVLLAKEKMLVDAPKSSNYTMQIVAADQRNDQLLVGIKNLLTLSVHHFNPVIAEAAISLQNRMKPFGNIARKSYEEEAAAIKILLVDLKGEYAHKAELIGLTPWLNELEIAVAEFERLLHLRNSEQAAKPLERLWEIRRDIETVYRQMIDRISSFNTIDEKGTYTEFIRQLNVQIDYSNAHNRKPSLKDVKNAVVKPITPQQYKGKPITPIPEVSLEGMELVFAKDFILSYKNNESVGNAKITIQGKGAYKGKKSITFFITE
ncbi:MAG: DUF6261 family protein [Tannerellaceae bacterium]|jgi:hypothetical protein|nr:DUF6261 family protein [Tannerellaceae bacterium]